MKILIGIMTLFSCSQQALGVSLGTCPTFKKVTEKAQNSSLSFTISAFAPEFKSVSVDTRNKSIVCTYQSDTGDTYNAYAPLGEFKTCVFGLHGDAKCTSTTNDVTQCSISCS